MKIVLIWVELLEKLNPGSSVGNPIDFLATGTAEQLGTIIDYVDEKFDNIDGMIVIFGTPGLFKIFDVYELLDKKMKTAKKPIYPVLPSTETAKEEVTEFISKGRINFPDEVALGYALTKVFYTPEPAPEKIDLPEVDRKTIRQVIENSNDGYLSPAGIQKLLDAAGISRVSEAVAKTKADAKKFASELGFPVVMKVVGPLHKSDVDGVVLGINDIETAGKEFDRMMKIKDTSAVLIQPMLSGVELFAGAKYEPKFGHLILCGLGGIFIEVLKDIKAGLSPLSLKEARNMIKNLNAYKIIKGIRGQEGVNEEKFAETIIRVSALLEAAPEIVELDINPLLGNMEKVIAVDARIRVNHKN